MTLWLPEAVEREYQARRLADAAKIAVAVELKEQLEHWTRELQKIDPYLRLVKARERGGPVAGLKPGFYHILRTPPGGVPLVEPVQGPGGEFREPGSHMFDQLRASDMWNDQVHRERERRMREAELAAEREREREIRERTDEFMERIKAKFNPGVSMSQAGPWSYRAGARKKAA